MASNPPPGVPRVPTGDVAFIGIPDSMDIPRLVYCAPYFQQVPLAELIEPAVIEATENALPSLVPPYVDAAAQAAVQAQAVLLVGSSMSGPLFLNPLMPTADAQAATKAYVDTMLATAGIPEVPPVPVGQIWGRETGQWVAISQQTGTFLPLAGGTMLGNINMNGNTLTNMAAVPAMPNGAAPAQWVLNQIASVSLYQGTWDADTNVPDLTQLSTHVNAYTWIAITTSVSGVVVSQPIPGLQGQTVFNGDTIIYSTAQGSFSHIHAGGLSLPEAQSLFVQLAGSQMSGPLLLNADATQPTQAVTFEQLTNALNNVVTPDAPADGQGYLRVGVGANRWVPGLPLAGGILTGALTLSGQATQALNAVPLNQVQSLITAATTGFLPLAGGQMTGAMQLSGNATVALNPVPFQQLTTLLGAYAPINSPTFTGTVTIPAGASIADYLPLAGGTLTGALTLPNVNATGNQAVRFTQLAGYLPLTGGTLTGPLSGTSLTMSGSATINNLDVVAGLIVTQNAGSVAIQVNSGTCVFTGNLRPATDDTVNVGFSGNSFNGMSSYAFNNASDPRLKKDTATSPAGALAKIEAIPVINFRWLSEAETVPLHTGFDASQVQAAIPGAPVVGVGTDDNQTLSLNTMELIAWLWQAVQELAAQVKALQPATA